MRLVSRGVFVGLVWIGLVSTGAAQAPSPFPYYGMGLGGGTYYDHASTVEEGAARGMADVIRSSGAANLMNSAAAINYQTAQKQYIENRLQATQTYFEMKRVNKESRQAMRPQPASQQQLIRFSKQQLPDRLSTTDLDPLTGSLNWPLILQSQEFANDRAMMEQLFGKRASEGHLSPDQYLQAKQVLDDMMATLREVGSKFPSNLQSEALKFLRSLQYEASFQA